MIGNALELTQFLCQQAQNSGFAKAAIVTVLDNNGGLHKSEFGLTMTDQTVQEDNVIEMVAADEDAVEDAEVTAETEETAE